MIYNHVTFPLSKNDLRMVKSVPQGGNWKNISLDIPSKRLEQIRRSGGRTTLYGRLSWKKPSYTITTYFNRPGNGAYIHPSSDRVISAREAARLQSFPDSFIFGGTKTSLCKQIGNAVPPLLAYVIALEIKKRTGTSSVLDLFCGAGGLSLGFEWAGFNIALANDNFAHACATYRLNHSTTTLVEGDITLSSVKNTLVSDAKKSGVDIVIGGPPCQGFSNAGKRMIDDPRNLLYREFVSIVKDIQPAVFVMENVEGIMTINEGKTFEEIQGHFSSLGYRVAGQKLHAVQFGVPQKRKRVVIIGLRSGDPKTCFPKPILSNEDTYQTVVSAIGDLPDTDVSPDKIFSYATAKHAYQRFMRGSLSPAKYLQTLRKTARA